MCIEDTLDMSKIENCVKTGLDGQTFSTTVAAFSMYLVRCDNKYSQAFVHGYSR